MRRFPPSSPERTWAGGGSALYASRPLQRRWRDAHAITQHFAVEADVLTLAGAVLAGQDVDVSFL